LPVATVEIGKGIDGISLRGSLRFPINAIVKWKTKNGLWGIEWSRDR